MGLFTKPLRFIDALWKTGLGIFQTFFDWLKFGYVWIVGLILAVLAIGGRVTEFMWAQLQVAFDLIVNVGVSKHDLAQTAAGNLLDIANIFFPVAEIFTLLTALSATMLSMMVYRLIKSWIPSVN
jgi:hypothetical protein